MLLNLHTHHFSKHGNEREIFNLIIPQEEEKLEDFPEKVPENTWLSVGIHPWYINENSWEEQLKKLSQLIDNQQVKLIGECGLDRLQGVSLKLQETVFIQQIRLAEEVNKPLIIHCVRCFNELISIKKIIRPRVPMIVHGFNQNLEIGVQLLEKEFYLSLGTAILQQNSNAAKMLKDMPLENLFLETDDKEIPIETIFKKAAEIREMAVGELEDIIFENFLDLQLS